MSGVRFVVVTGAAYWSSYLVNGDDSGIDAAETAQADAWLKRHAVSVIDVIRDADGEAKEARFTWSYGLHCPDADVSGGEVLDYLCEPLNPADWPESSFI